MGSKQNNSFYFDNFIACADYACQAAHLLEKGMREFDPDRIGDMLDEMHAVEHAGDEKKHELLNVLAKAFITPVEREDIILLGQNIDEVTDKIEDVLLRIYCNNVRSVRPDALELVAVAIKCCGEVKDMLVEFPRFKNSKKLHEHIGDDPIAIIVWREIYIYLEKCVDACEHVADTVESVVMKNS